MELSKISLAISKLTQVVNNNDISSLLLRYCKSMKKKLFIFTLLTCTKNLIRINKFSINLYKSWDESPTLSLTKEDSLGKYI